MPIGDPHGGNFRYTTEGLPESVFMASVPSREPRSLMHFYRDVLMMDVVLESEDEVFMRRGSARLRIYRSGSPGIDTGIFIGVEDAYDFHRRMIDEGVRFALDPKRLPLGVATSFLDPEGNTLYATETGAEPKDLNDAQGCGRR